MNVEAARADRASVWHHYRELIDLRHNSDLLVNGDYGLLTPDDPQLWAYRRTLGVERALVVLNWSDEPATYAPPDPIATGAATLLLGSRESTPDAADPLWLRPYEARVYELPDREPP